MDRSLSSAGVSLDPRRCSSRLQVAAFSGCRGIADAKLVAAAGKHVREGSAFRDGELLLASILEDYIAGLTDAIAMDLPPDADKLRPRSFIVTFSSLSPNSSAITWPSVRADVLPHFLAAVAEAGALTAAQCSVPAELVHGAESSSLRPMESHISAVEAAQTFPDVIERVHSRGDVFIVEQEGEPMCRIAPVSPARRTVRDLVRLLQAMPPPDDAYLDVVEEIAKNQPTLPESPWER
jgi:antitoxin (DNA-binding transcriptional repressor) of toxin-antitoxin stability system